MRSLKIEESFEPLFSAMPAYLLFYNVESLIQMIKRIGQKKNKDTSIKRNQYKALFVGSTALSIPVL